MNFYHKVDTKTIAANKIGIILIVPAISLVKLSIIVDKLCSFFFNETFFIKKFLMLLLKDSADTKNYQNQSFNRNS